MNGSYFKSAPAATTFESAVEAEMRKASRARSRVSGSRRPMARRCHTASPRPTLPLPASRRPPTTFGDRTSHCRGARRSANAATKTLHSSDGCSDKPTAPSSPRGLSLAGRAAGSGNPAHEQNRRASTQVLVNNSVQRAHARAFSIPPGDARRFDASNRHQGGWACTRPPPRTSAFASCGHAVPSAQDR
jgi:hypothetical protein